MNTSKTTARSTYPEAGSTLSHQRMSKFLTAGGNYDSVLTIPASFQAPVVGHKVTLIRSTQPLSHPSVTSSVFPFRFGCSILLLNFQNEPLHNAGFLSCPFFFHNPAATVSVKHVYRSQRACTAHVAAFPRGRLPLLEIEWTSEKAYVDLFLLPFLIHIS